MIKSALQLAVRPIARSGVLSGGKFGVLPCIRMTDIRNIHVTLNAMKEIRQGKDKVRTRPDADYIAEGEQAVNIATTDSLFPDASTPTKLFDNIPFNKLHIVNIKTTKNNTIMTVTDYKGVPMICHSCGVEGFKNTRKGTNIAAQQTATTVGLRALEGGVTTVRIRVQGLGPGRAGALKGLQLAGLNIVSITDDTRVSWNPPRPRKQRRI